MTPKGLARDIEKMRASHTTGADVQEILSEKISHHTQGNRIARILRTD